MKGYVLKEHLIADTSLGRYMIYTLHNDGFFRPIFLEPTMPEPGIDSRHIDRFDEVTLFIPCDKSTWPPDGIDAEIWRIDSKGHLKYFKDVRTSFRPHDGLVAWRPVDEPKYSIRETAGFCGTFYNPSATWEEVQECIESMDSSMTITIKKL